MWRHRAHSFFPIRAVRPPALAARSLATVTVMGSPGRALRSPTSAKPVGLRFELFVDNVELSVAFYGATLGFEPPESWSPDGYVALRADVVVIDVQYHSKLPPGHHFGPSRLTGPRGVGIEIVVEVEDVHLAYVRLMSGQIRSEQPRKRAGVAGSQNLLLTSHGVFATSDSSIPMGTTYGSRRAVGNRTGNAASTTDRRQ